MGLGGLGAAEASGSTAATRQMLHFQDLPDRKDNPVWERLRGSDGRRVPRHVLLVRCGTSCPAASTETERRAEEHQPRHPDGKFKRG